MVADNFFCCFRSCHVDFHTCHFASQSHNCKTTIKTVYSCVFFAFNEFVSFFCSYSQPVLANTAKRLPQTINPTRRHFWGMWLIRQPIHRRRIRKERKPTAYAVSCFRHHIRPPDLIRKKNTAVARVQCVLMTVAFPLIPASETYSAKRFQPKM